ncbi:MAG: DinB family protein [Actinomycetota bacterium]
MVQDTRVEPPSASEKETLEAFLDYHRQTVTIKCAGLTEEELRRPMVVSGTSMLGIVKHLGYVERWWFQEIFAAQETEFPQKEDDPDAEFRIDDHETAESVFEFYTTECDKSRAIIAQADLDDIASHSKSVRSLRWILLHLLEETSRHNGHLDILREMIDGTTGE